MTYIPPSSEFYQSLIQNILGDDIICEKVYIHDHFYGLDFSYRIEALFKQNIFIWYYRDQETREWRSKPLKWYGIHDSMQYAEPKHKYGFKVTQGTIFRKKCVFNQIVYEDFINRPELIVDIIAKYARKYIYMGLAQEIVYK